MSDKLNIPEKDCPTCGARMQRQGMLYTCSACVNPPTLSSVRPSSPGDEPAQRQRTPTDFRRWVNDVSDALGIRPPSPLV